MPRDGGMTLAGFLIAGPVAHRHTLWRNPDHDVPFLSLQYYVDIARILECGKFDLIFFADRLAIADRFGSDRCAGLNDDRPALRAPEFVNFVVPDLQNMKVFRSEYRAATLRGNLQSRG